jgi:signal transduction histidine kinase
MRKAFFLIVFLAAFQLSEAQYSFSDSIKYSLEPKKDSLAIVKNDSIKYRLLTQIICFCLTKKLNNKVEIRVADNGNGIPQNIVDKIFQPFFTTKPTGQGTGLGLSLAYDIIKAHGGEIKVGTKEGEGSEFVIQLPI